MAEQCPVCGRKMGRGLGSTVFTPFETTIAKGISLGVYQEGMCNNCLDSAIETASKKAEAFEKREILKSKSINAIGGITPFIIFGILSYGIIPIFLSKLWFIFAVPIGIVASAAISAILYCIIVKTRIEKIIFVSIILIALSIGISYMAKEYGNKLQADIKKEEAAKKQAEFESRNRKEREELAMLAKEQEEYQKFLKTGESVITYEIYSNNTSTVKRRATEALKRFALDPNSVQDVQPLTGIVRVHVRGYPTCRYAITVRYRAKNAFGGLVLNEGIVLLDRERIGVAVLKRFP